MLRRNLITRFQGGKSYATQTRNIYITHVNFEFFNIVFRTSAYSHEGATANLAFEHDEISAPALVAGVASSRTHQQQGAAASVTTVDRRSSGALSAADRSATEITEYHAYNVQRSEVSSFDTWKRQK